MQFLFSILAYYIYNIYYSNLAPNVSVVSSRAATELTYLSYFHQDSKYSGSRGDVVLERQCCAAHAVHTDPGHRSRSDCPKRACPSLADDFLSRSLSTFWPYQNNLIKRGPKDILINFYNFWSFCIFVTFHHFGNDDLLLPSAHWVEPGEPCGPENRFLVKAPLGRGHCAQRAKVFFPHGHVWSMGIAWYSRIAPKWHFEWGKWMKINENDDSWSFGVLYVQRNSNKFSMHRQFQRKFPKPPLEGSRHVQFEDHFRSFDGLFEQIDCRSPSVASAWIS